MSAPSEQPHPFQQLSHKLQLKSSFPSVIQITPVSFPCAFDSAIFVFVCCHNVLFEFSWSPSHVFLALSPLCAVMSAVVTESALQPTPLNIAYIHRVWMSAKSYGLWGQHVVCTVECHFIESWKHKLTKYWVIISGGREDFLLLLSYSCYVCVFWLSQNVVFQLSLGKK